MTEADLRAQAPAWLHNGELPGHLTHLPRRREWLAGRVLAGRVLAALTGTAYHSTPPLVADAFGRPGFADLVGRVALSHGAGHVAALVALGAGRRCGIDVEPVRAKALALVTRFMAPAELPGVGTALPRAALAWSAKESLYKAYGRRQLDFRQHLYLDPAGWPPAGTPLPETGSLRGRITQPHGGQQWWHDVAYSFQPNGALLTWCATPPPPASLLLT